MSASIIEAAWRMTACFALAGCRLGGPSGDPSLPVGDAAAVREAALDVAPDSRPNGADVGAAGAPVGAADASGEEIPDVSSSDVVAPPDDAAAMPDAGGDADAKGDGGFDGPPGASDADLDSPSADAVFDSQLPDERGDESTCVPPFASAVCDPVCNTDCAPLMRCNVSDMPQTGVCMGMWIGVEGEPCLRTPTTDPCAPRLTCVAGICRRLCYDADDCTTAGTCCNTSIDIDGGPSGYRICLSCSD